MCAIHLRFFPPAGFPNALTNPRALFRLGLSARSRHWRAIWRQPACHSARSPFGSKFFRLSLKRKPAKKLCLFHRVQKIGVKMLCMTPYFFPKERFGGRSMPAKLTAVDKCFVWSLGRSSVASGCPSSCPACRPCLPCHGRQSPSPWQPASRSPSAECGNPRLPDCAGAISGSLFGRPLRPHNLPLSHCGALLPFPSQRGSGSLRSPSPRHAVQTSAPSDQICISGYRGTFPLAAGAKQSRK